MSATLKPWSVAEFLEWEERQELRHEFDGFRPVAMTGGSFEHDAIQVSLVAELYVRLKGKPCRVHGSNLKIEVMGRIRYPDAFVTCAPVRRGSTVLHEPVVIFEVVSKSTAQTDHGAKNREYAATATVMRYVILEQSGVAATMFTRGPSGAWTGEILGPDATLAMPEIGIDLPLAEIYAGIDLSGAEPD